MHFAHTKRPLGIVALWFGTVVVAYSLGRITMRDPARSPGRDSHRPAVESASASATTIRAEDHTFFSGLARSRDEMMRSIAEVTAGHPMEEWLKRLLAQDDEIIRATGFLRLLEALNSSADIERALAVVKSSVRNRGERSRESALLLQKWTEIDPKAAIAYATRAKGNEERGVAATAVLRTWTRLDPNEALAWAEANGKSVNGQDANAQEGNWAVAAVVAQLARTNVDRALDVASTQELSRARARMMETLVSELVAQRGGDAARDAILALPEGTFRDNMTVQLAGRLADANGAATAEWVMSLPPGPARSSALREVVDEWSADDAVATGNFLARFPISAETDPSRERYAWNVLPSDPEGAIAWAQTISEEEQRMRALENLVTRWMRRNRAEAADWLAQSNLPAQLKAKLAPRN